MQKSTCLCWHKHTCRMECYAVSKLNENLKNKTVKIQVEKIKSKYALILNICTKRGTINTDCKQNMLCKF